jgi:GH25 family lysozyme M1 (1,4-beta-N-acetylmuramidase)
MWRAVAAGGVAVALSLAAAPGARPAVAGAASEPLRGLDISAYQHDGTPINWKLLARQGVRFIAVKVSEGTYYRNPYYPSDARDAGTAGLRVMPYAFANPSRSGGAATASFAVRTVRAVGAGRGRAGLPLVVDLENDPYKKATDCYGVSVAAMISWIAGFTGRAQALTGKWPIIYTTAAWWRECTGSTGRFRYDPLWLAAFGGTRPTVPSPWAHWTFWQYDNAGFLPGIGQTDLDYYQPTSGLPALRPYPLARPRPAAPPHPRKHLAKRHMTAKAKPGAHQKSASKDRLRSGRQGKGRLKRAPKGHAKGKHGPKPRKHKRQGPVSSGYPGKLG